ncbi:MAG: hypothetical protein LBN05_04630, partial [Oscillospiraceae bacterium]|nr:hypothetical protein [Oscillospiraceae bacterium]
MDNEQLLWGGNLPPIIPPETVYSRSGDHKGRPYNQLFIVLCSLHGKSIYFTNSHKRVILCWGCKGMDVYRLKEELRAVHDPRR